MRLIYSILLSLSLGFVFGQNPGPYAPAARQAGSTAIHKDSLQTGYWKLGYASLGKCKQLDHGGQILNCNLWASGLYKSRPAEPFVVRLGIFAFWGE